MKPFAALVLLALLGCWSPDTAAIPDNVEQVAGSQPSPEGAVVAAIRHVVSERRLGEDGDVVTVVPEASTMLAALHRHGISAEIQTSETCELTGEPIEIDGDVLAPSECTIPDGLVELHVRIHAEKRGIYVVEFVEVKRRAFVYAPAPGHKTTSKAYRVMAEWLPEEGWATVIDYGVGTDL